MRQRLHRRSIPLAERPFKPRTVPRRLFGKRVQDVPRRLGIVPGIGRQGRKVNPVRRRDFRVPALRNGLPAAAGRPYRRHQLAVGERLAEASRETAGGEIRSVQIPARRHGDHLQSGIDPAHRLQHAEPVGRRHLYIGQHQVETALADEFGDVLGILAALASDPRAAAHRGGHFELQGIVVDQQNTQSRLRHRLPGFGGRTPRRLADGDRYDESAPLAEAALERNRAVQQLHETVDDRQPQPETADALRRA